MARLTLTFLGTFQIVLDHKPLLIRSGRIQALLAYLVLEAERAQTRAALAALFWPDEPETAAKQNLRQALYQLRQLLDTPAQTEPVPPPFLLISRELVQFNPASDYTLDVTLFQTELAQQQQATAVQRYQGDLLTGLNSTSPQFEEWLLLQREHLHIQLLAALTQLTQQALAQADYRQAQAYARRQLADVPWHEEAHRDLMLALALNGEQSAAQAQYESCRRLLAEALGVEPAAETQRLLARIRSGDLSDAPARDPKAEFVAAPTVDAATTPSSQPSPNRIDWGDAPDSRTFHGRQQELAALQRWIVDDHCRLVTILGMGGIGKTTLAARFVHSLVATPAFPPATAAPPTLPFAFVIWRSLLNAPPLPELLQNWLRFFSGQQAVEPATLDAQLSQLFVYLRQARCLLVLDNVESIMLGADEIGRAGYYLPGYADYGQLFKRMGETAHQSCLLVTSRELPQAMAHLERTTAVVRSLPLAGLTPSAGQAILQTQGLTSRGASTTALIERYSGNPLALMLVAETIQELFAGDVGAFLSEEAPIFDDIRDMLAEQFARLSALEQEILRWLAIEREPLTAQQLHANFPQPVPKRDLLEALNSLRRRALLERTLPSEHPVTPDTAEVGFALQNVVTEFITDTLIDQVTAEIEQLQPALLKRHALLNPQTKEYVRQSQQRLLLQPIATRLQGKLGAAGLIAQVRKLLTALQQQPDRQQHYAGGNLLNLLLHVKADLQHYDFSELAIWRAQLQGASLPAVNFTRCDLRDCVFTDTFDAISALDFSPDLPGQTLRLAAGTATGELRLWRVSDGQALAVRKGHTNYVFSVCFSPDGQLLASGSDDQLICLWQVDADQAAADRSVVLRQTLRGHTGGVWRLSMSPNGRLLASASGDRTVCLWALDSATGTAHLQHTWRDHERGVRSVAFSPDSQSVASGDEGGVIRLWAAASGAPLAVYQAHTRDVWSLAFSPDGQWLASGGYDRLVQLWPIASIIAATCRPDAPMPADISALGQQLSGHTGNVTAVAFSADSMTLASGSNDLTVRLWDVAERRVRHSLQGHTDRVEAVAFTPQGELLATGSADQTIRFWEVKSGQALRTWQGHVQGVNSVALTPDGAQIAAGYQDQKVRLWDRQRREVTRVLAAHTKELHVVAISPDGTLLASGSGDQTIQVWDIAHARPRFVLHGHEGLVRTLAFRADSKLLASGSNDHSVRLWDMASGEQYKRLPNQQSIWAVAFSADGETVACSGARQLIRLWQVASGENFLTLHGHSNWVTALAFSPTGSILASGSGDQAVYLWDTQSGELLTVLRGHAAWVYSLAFSPKGDWLASGSADKQICLWDMARHQLLRTLHGHSDAVRAVTFAPATNADPQASALVLVSGSSDESIRVWDPQTGQCLDILHAGRPYEDMKLNGVTGITAAQRAALQALGARADEG